MPLDATIIESTSSDFPAVLRKGALLGSCSRIWTVGNIDILGTRLLGFFCSIKCPGNVIVHTYDLARALRDASVPVIGGFHSPMERECLDLLLRGTQPIVICPARGIERMRLPATWHTPLSEARLRVISPFAGQYRRPRATLAEQRNRLVAALADEIFVAHAGAESQTERLCAEIMAQRRRIYTLDVVENARVIQQGVIGHSVNKLVALLAHLSAPSPRVHGTLST
jgi:predicted Rossmann fold nucleotide-binding protein DprA/Smf involved in DNA uptake